MFLGYLTSKHANGQAILMDRRSKGGAAAQQENKLQCKSSATLDQQRTINTISQSIHEVLQ